MTGQYQATAFSRLLSATLTIAKNYWHDEPIREDDATREWMAFRCFGLTFRDIIYEDAARHCAHQFFTQRRRWLRGRRLRVI